MTDAEQKTVDEVYASPSAEAAPVESIVATETVRRAIVVGPIIVLAALVLRGADGAIAASIGVLVVMGNFLLAGLILSRAARVSMQAYHAAALAGFIVRLGLITASMFLIASVFEIDRPALGIAAVAAYFILLTWEAWALTKSPGREFEWKA